MPDPRANADALDDGWDEEPPSTAQKRIRTPEDGRDTPISAGARRSASEAVKAEYARELDRWQQGEEVRAASWAAMLKAVLALASTSVIGVGLYEIFKHPGQDDAMKLVAAGLAALTAAATGWRSKDDAR